MNRRDLVRWGAAGLMARSMSAQGQAADGGAKRPGAKDPEAKGMPGERPLPGIMPLGEYEPKSMLHAVATPVPRSRYPVIDLHTHLTMEAGLDKPGKLRYATTPEECLR